MGRRVQASVLALLAAPAAAQAPRMVLDLDTTRLASAPAGFVESRGVTYFTALEGGTGRELWRSDGTAAGTRRVADLCPGPCSSSPDLLTDLGGELYFAAGTPRELWRSDGTAAGTVLAASPSQRSRTWERIAAIAGEPGRVWFVALEGNEVRLWLTDGSPGGTSEVAGLATVTPTDWWVRVLPFGRSVLAGVYTGPSRNTALFGSDGTAAGTRLLCSSCTGPDLELVALGGQALFASGNVLWSTDGTPAETRFVFAFSSPLRDFTVLGSRALFVATTAELGSELWSTDGTPGGTRPVMDILPGPSGSTPDELVRLGGRIVFSAHGGGLDRELWTSDGSSSGTSRISRTSGQAGLAPGQMTSGGGLVFYLANDPIHGRELWRSDGTPWGSWMVRELAPGSAGVELPELVATSSGAYFRHDEGDGAELWNSDGGAPSGTRLVLKINQVGNSGSGVHVEGTAGDRVTFRSEEPLLLWGSDGTAAGTEQLVRPGWGAFLTSIWQGRRSVSARGRFFYTVCCQPELTRPDGSYTALTDGTQAGTSVLDWRDPGGAPPSDPRLFIATSSTVFYSGGGSGWMTDGTIAGTRETEVSVSLELSRTFGGRVIWWGPVGQEPWIGDGTQSRSFQLADTRNAKGLHDLVAPAAQGGRAWFASWKNRDQVDLWSSDGTPAGTSLSLTLPPGFRHFAPEQPASGLLLVAHDGTTQLQLWRTDGTPAGTRVLTDDPGADFVQFGDDVLFAGRDAGTGRELWRTDGVTAWRVADLCSPDCDGDPQGFTAFDDAVFFSAVDFTGGRELWRSDGTPAGTRRVADVAPGPYSSDPATLVAAGSRLFFAADDGVHGRELWVLEGRSGPALLRGEELPLDPVRDRHVAPCFPGRYDPDPLALPDASRPLLFYRLDDAARVLTLAKTPTSRIRIHF